MGDSMMWNTHQSNDGNCCGNDLHPTHSIASGKDDVFWVGSDAEAGAIQDSSEGISSSFRAENRSDSVCPAPFPMEVYEYDPPFDDDEDEDNDEDYSENYYPDEEDDSVLDFVIEIGNYLRARDRGDTSYPAPFEIEPGPAATQDM